MNQDNINRILELEEKFREFSESGDPHLVDNGFFLDAVLNVTTILKAPENQNRPCPSLGENGMDNHIRVINNLYNSLKEFESLYNHCLKDLN